MIALSCESEIVTSHRRAERGPSDISYEKLFSAILRAGEVPLTET